MSAISKSAKRKKSSRATKKKSDEPNIKNWLTHKLRRISYQWGPRKIALAKSRIARGKYKCASCGGEDFGPKDIQLDHIKPVIDPHFGFTDWNSYIERLFCSENGFQTLCVSCHKYKTFQEDEVRKMVKSEKQPKIEEDI